MKPRTPLCGECMGKRAGLSAHKGKDIPSVPVMQALNIYHTPLLLFYDLVNLSVSKVPSLVLETDGSYFIS